MKMKVVGLSLMTVVMKPQRQIDHLPTLREPPCRYLLQIGTHPWMGQVQTQRTYSPQRLICPRHLRTVLLIIPLQLIRRSHRGIYPHLPQICFSVHLKGSAVTPLHQQRAHQKLLFTVSWRVSLKWTLLIFPWSSLHPCLNFHPGMVSGASSVFLSFLYFYLFYLIIFSQNVVWVSILANPPQSNVSKILNNTSCKRTE